MIKLFYKFMIERESIRLRKEQGLPFPWTYDPILQAYKFTNVKRLHDRTTQELKKIYDANRNKSRASQLLNCTIYRYFGTYEFANALGWQEKFNPKYIIDTARHRMDCKQRVFTGAYVVTNQGIKAPKEEVVVDIFIKGIMEHEKKLEQLVDSTNSWRNVIQYLMMNVTGFGGTGFMAKEVVLDTMLTSFWQYTPDDLNTWCPAGPGARRGLNRIFGRPLNLQLSGDHLLKEMLGIFGMRDDFWPEDFVRLELHDIQFQLCEFDKYLRVKNGEGRPRSKYAAPI